MRLYELTRSKSFLRRGCLVLLTAALVVSWCIRLLNPTYRNTVYSQDHLESHVLVELEKNVITPLQIRQQYHELRQLPQPSPAKFSQWLRHLSTLRHSEVIQNAIVFQPASTGTGIADAHAATTNVDSVISTIFDCSIPEALQAHTRDPLERQVFQQYINCLFHQDPSVHKNAYEQLLQISKQTPTPRFAHEFLGDLQLILQEKREALRSYLLEANQSEASYALTQALTLALQLEDDAALGQLIASPHFRSDNIDHHQLRKIAHLLKSRSILAKAHWKLICDHWSQPVQVTIALFTLLIWGLILFYSGNRNKRILFLGALAVCCGVFSGWLTRWSLDAFQYHADPGPSPSQSSTRMLLHSVLYIGIPEEAAKLLLLLPFIPWILMQRRNDPEAAPTTALLGGFVGLGFALEENLQYFMDGSEAVALGRLVTANVIHFSLTGYIAWHFHQLIQSRFNTAVDFLATFLFMAVAHGAYDFLIIDAHAWGTDFFAILILALIAKQYLRCLVGMTSTSHQSAISRTSVFVFGATFLTGLIMIIYTWRTLGSDSETIVPILQSAISLVPIALIYVHEFDEVRGA